jgi:hypothetical protein
LRRRRRRVFLSFWGGGAGYQKEPTREQGTGNRKQGTGKRVPVVLSFFPKSNRIPIVDVDANIGYSLSVK